MKQIKPGKRCIVASVLTLCFLSAPMKTFASDITGVLPNGNVFNISPSANNGNVGYRKYVNFNLDKGDVANLIFNYAGKDVTKFVNLVDNTININGLVNTVRNNAFYDGHAIFISPTRMVIGSSGVLNVASLSVITPTNDVYSTYKGNLWQTAKLFQSQDPVTNEGSGIVTINGKVIARNNINIQAGDVIVNPSAGVVAGVNDLATLTNTEAQAKTLFDAIVNTSNMNEANSFVSNNGNVSIKAYGTNGGVTVDSNITNYGNGNINLETSGSKGLNISTTVSNRDGNTTLTNTGSNGIKV